jgi:hypothetical protein
MYLLGSGFEVRGSSSDVVFIMNTIPAQGIRAVCKISEGKASIPYGKAYS